MLFGHLSREQFDLMVFL